MIFAFFSQKGGVAKTTTTLDIAKIIANKGKKILLVDLDPQASLTNQVLGYDPVSEDITKHNTLFKNETSYNALTGDGELPVKETKYTNISIVPSSTLAMSGVEMDMVTGEESLDNLRVARLKKALVKKEEEFDHIFIDTAGGLGILTFNALYSADHAIALTVPGKLERDSLKASFKVIKGYQEKYGFNVNILKVLPTMVKIYLPTHKEAIHKLRQDKEICPLLARTFIPDNIKIKSAQEENMTVQEHTWFATSAEAYRDFVEELAESVELY